MPGRFCSKIAPRVPFSTLIPRRRLVLRENNFRFLLTGLVLTLLVGPLLREVPLLAQNPEVLDWLVESVFSLMVLIGVWSLNENREVFRTGLLLGFLSLLFPVLAWNYRTLAFAVLEILVILIFCVLSCYLAALHVFRGRDADINRLSGSVCIFLLIGFIWGFIYVLLTMAIPGAFRGIDVGGILDGRYDELLYFSFATLTTLGYGDIIPVIPLARTLSVLEVMCGQFYLTILVASLVGNFLAERLRR